MPWFPSPCGVLVLKLFMEHTSYSPSTIKFPSPCGVLVLKYDSRAIYGDFRRGFRPLAGFWFLNSRMDCSRRSRAVLFPSPCGVLVLK